MAGPGGGPPRRSHTKSRRGCKTCKRRHIRCDETFPQCRNCTKHSCRCDYMDAPPPEEAPESPQPPDLLWNPEVELVVDQWAATGEFPFPDFQLSNPLPLASLSRLDLRLLHHLASVSMEMHVRDVAKLTVWSRKIPTFLDLASQYPYVMYALLGFSATHLAWITENASTDQVATHHRVVAVSGLKEAIGNFSRENADAVLAASMLLKWQFPEWHGWASLMQGTATVIDVMQEWKDESLFADMIAEQAICPRAPPSPVPIDPSRGTEPRQEDINMLKQVYQALNKLETVVSGHINELKGVQELIAFVRNLRMHLSLHAPAEQFKLLSPLRAWIFWLPISFLQKMGSVPSVMVVIAHFYAVALAVEPLFPDLGSAYFGSMSVPPIEEITQSLTALQASGTLNSDELSLVSMMDFPLEMVSRFRYRMGWTVDSGLSIATFDATQPQQQSPFPDETFSLGVSAEESLPTPFTPSIEFGFEDDPTITHHGEPASPASQIGGLSPYAFGTDAFGVPNYAAYSPSGYSSISGMSNPLGYVEEEGPEEFEHPYQQELFATPGTFEGGGAAFSPYHQKFGSSSVSIPGGLVMTLQS